jgi:hypothetical protein
VQIEATAVWPGTLKTREQRGLPLPSPADLQ